MTQGEIVTAVAFSIAFLESELPEVIRPGKLSAFEREIWHSILALRTLHQQLSPEAGRLAAVGADPARRSNFGNVGQPPAEF